MYQTQKNNLHVRFSLCFFFFTKKAIVKAFKTKRYFPLFRGLREPALVQQGRSVDMWYRETRGRAADDSRATERIREETTVYTRNEDLEDSFEHQCCLADDFSRLFMGILCIIVSSNRAHSLPYVYSKSLNGFD